MKNVTEGAVAIPLPRLTCAAIAAAVAIVLAVYAFSLRGSTLKLVSVVPVTYYQLLTDAFRSGQLHLKPAPTPALLAMSNPYGGYQGIERYHDASLYNGKYYVYFSPVPVLTLLGPWHVVTGSFLADAVATVTFGAIGFGFGAALIVSAGRRFFPGLPWFALPLAVLLFGLGHYGLFVLQSPQVYPVPTLCGYAFLMTSVWCAWRAAGGSGVSRSPVAWVALASLAFGLAVASRPVYVFSVPCLVIPAFAALLGTPESARKRSLRLKLFLAASLPAAAIGVALAVYNYLRFDSPFEFGLRYQLGSVDLRFIKLFDPANLASGLMAYFLAPIVWTPYFPFIELPLGLPGIVWGAPLLLVGLAAPLTLLRPGLRTQPAWWSALSVLTLASVANVTALCLYPFPVDRYATDFVPGLTLAALAVWATASSAGFRWLSRGLGALALVTLVTCCTLALKRYERPTDLAGLQRWAHGIVGAFQKSLGIEHGTATLEFTLPAPTPGPAQPLLSTGRGRDIVFAAPDASAGRWRLGFYSPGVGTRESAPLDIAVGKTHRLEITLASLLPPASHPAFARWEGPAISAFRRRFELKLDDRTVLRSELETEASAPGDISIGAYPGPSPDFARTASRRVTLLDRGGVPSPEVFTAQRLPNPLRMKVRFPAFRASAGEPLLSSGRSGAGDLLYVLYVNENTVRFGHDHWDGGALESESITVDPGREYSLEFNWVALDPTAPVGTARQGLFELRIDGRVILRAPRPFWIAAPTEVSPGYNSIGASSAGPGFNGEIVEIAAATPFRSDEMQGSLGRFGPLRLTVRLPVGQSGLQQPLLVTGRPHAGDLIYVVYVDERHIRIGYDHWGGGATVSELIPVDYAAAHRFEISLGSLYPAESDPAWGETPADVRTQRMKTFVVKLDGREVFQMPAEPHRCEPHEIYPGRNPIGGSTCGERFLGQILITDMAELPPTSAF